jgi:hypothetical protein
MHSFISYGNSLSSNVHDCLSFLCDALLSSFRLFFILSPHFFFVSAKRQRQKQKEIVVYESERHHNIYVANVKSCTQGVEAVAHTMRAQSEAIQ